MSGLEVTSTWLILAALLLAACLGLWEAMNE